MARFIDELKRTHSCGALRLPDVGSEVVLFGWIASRRDHGGCIFIDLRDRDGITQIVFDSGIDKTSHGLAEAMRGEWVIGIRGRVRDRGAMRNPKMSTGEVEVEVLEGTVFNKAKSPPFELVDDPNTAEERRLTYRYLDLRRAPMQRTFRMRHRIYQATRRYFDENDFTEVETPLMVKYTPGGARNFLVPSRMNAGHFYALAESPQLYKQLLMVAGFERYFQIVKCFRDEDLRLDRQPEFTQIDVEMSFINQDDLFRMMEGLVFRVFKAAIDVDLHQWYPTGRFPQLDFYEAMEKYGSDKPDLRFGLPHTELTKLAIEHSGGGIPFFAEIAAKYQNGQLRLEYPEEIIKALRVPASANLSRAFLDSLEDFVKQNGGKGLARAKVAEDGAWAQSPLTKIVTDEFRTAVNAATGAEPGDILLFQSGAEARVHVVMANLRVYLAKKMGLVPESGSGGVWNLSWVIAPPLFEKNDDGTWSAAHHAFTRPYDEDVAMVDSDPGRVRCYRYDLVLNGFEIGGGSIRLHDPEVQAKVFQTLGIPEAERERLFGFLLDALAHGAPPHGGIAVGLDRVTMLLSEGTSIRDVVAFPKTSKGTCMMTKCPDPVDAKQLEELHIRVQLPKPAA